VDYEEFHQARHKTAYEQIRDLYKTLALRGKSDTNQSRVDIRNKLGYQKIQNACSIALRLGLRYLWIDTCCIDQQNPDDIAQNIRSMYAYYRNSVICLVYLFDIGIKHSLESEWFSRGWTLQEYVAPREVLFFNRVWHFKGSRSILKQEIKDLTGINEEVLEGTMSAKDVKVWDRRRWVRGRITTKPQDVAYCLMEILDVKLEADYSESVEDTCKRLQVAVIGAHRELFGSLDFNEIAWGFLAAGRPVPPAFWPARKSEVIMST